MNTLTAIFTPRKASPEKRVAFTEPEETEAGQESSRLPRVFQAVVAKMDPSSRNTKSPSPSPAKAPKAQVAVDGAAPSGSQEKKSPIGGTSRRRSTDPYDFNVDESQEAAPPQSEERFEFVGFKGHRWAGDTVEIEVEWDKGDPTWEPEENLHRDAPAALFAYWDAQGGRPSNPRDAGLYNIFAIRDHSKDRKRLLVEWVGFGPKEATWMARPAVMRSAPAMVRQYFLDLEPKTRRGKKRATRKRD